MLNSMDKRKDHKTRKIINKVFQCTFHFFLEVVFDT